MCMYEYTCAHLHFQTLTVMVLHPPKIQVSRKEMISGDGKKKSIFVFFERVLKTDHYFSCFIDGVANRHGT